MKLLVAFFFTSFSCRQPVWFSDFGRATKLAAKSGKLLLLNFSNPNDCKACNDWRNELFQSDTFKNFATKKLVLINVELSAVKRNSFIKPQDAEYKMLASKYNAAYQFPYTVLIDANGNELAHWNLTQEFSAEKYMNDLNTIFYKQTTTLRVIK